MHVAIDLGAGSGRVMLGRLGDLGFSLEEVHRFRYPPAERQGHLRWDMAVIGRGIEEGLRAAGARARAMGSAPLTVGIDTWGVDYGLVDAQGQLVEEPACYRDPLRTALMAEVLDRVPRAEMFARTGIQFLPFNTVYQLYAHVREGLPAGAARLLMMPDLLHRHLCGNDRGEYTNASTTQLLDPRTRTWNDGLFERLGLPRELMPELANPGDRLGTLRPALARSLELPSLEVIAPATHDTGSAVMGTPLRPGWAYVSSGTWSLVGVERALPLLGDAVAEASFTNEGGAFGTVRFLKNVMGLWILEGCRKEWTEAGRADVDHEALVTKAAALPRSPGFVFPDAHRFFNPGSMVAELRAALVESGFPATEDPIALTRVILDSLALRYASVVAAIENLTGDSIPGLHVVGGGCRNDYLNQATANATGKPVLAGPVEATAIGNILVQAIASGEAASPAEARSLVARALPAREFEPAASTEWRAARDRYRDLEARAAPSR